ncbi:phospholipase D-like domain-containing protein [Peribacillus simplex]|uniref:phospholipase D-like domain-containing protein n=1 Tax=Peribacillus simplex TaxID=1478 RepID=UPI0028530F10|nr:phospholipase D-like domain-containing protein [Peribacillus simplex]MDR4928274.1 hypothetical protein [Peribacillus simplex]
MIKLNKSLENVELLLTKGRSNFEEITQSIKDSKSLFISTYNIDFRLFEKVDKNTEIEVITSIPSVKNIYWYIKGLKELHTNFNKVSTYINLDNHSKIIITDTKAYVGSANFTKYSKNNFECGLIIDGDNINKVIDLFQNLKTDAILYDGTNYKVTRITIIMKQLEEIKVNIENHISDLEKLKDLIDRHYEDREYYRDFEDFKSDGYEKIVYKIDDLIEDSIDVIDICQDNDDDFLIDDLNSITVRTEWNSFLNTFMLKIEKLLNFQIEKYRDKMYMEEVHNVETDRDSEILEEANEFAIQELKELSDNSISSLTNLIEYIRVNLIPSLNCIISNCEHYEDEGEEAYKPSSASLDDGEKKIKTIEKL